MDSGNLDQIAKGIDAILHALRPQFEMLFDAPQTEKKRISRNLSDRVKNESRNLLYAWMSILTKSCLNRPFFSKDPAHQNLFWRRNLEQDVYSGFSFEYTLDMRKIPKSIPVSMPLFAVVGGILFGIVLSILFRSFLVLLIFILASGVAFFCLKTIIRKLNLDSRRVFADRSLASLKQNLLDWLGEIESFAEREILKIENGEMK